MYENAATHVLRDGIRNQRGPPHRITKNDDALVLIRKYDVFQLC